MLSAMLNDPELENRRLALITLNSATQNKGALILPHLSQLLPLVIKESNINPALIREVQMGPFKHKVDDGLEIRKVRGSFEDVVQAVLIDSLRVPTKRCMP
jgi:cullin-associated NEDD8-dissociated protein 1